MKDLVSIVVVNHNRRHMLRSCLQSLIEQSYQDFEVWVVDNASSDGSPSVVQEIHDSRFHLIQLDRNYGFSGGCNEGIKSSRGAWIALLNNDAEAESHWLESLLDGARKPGIGMCASKILYYNSKVIDKAGHLIFPDGQNRGRGTGQPDLGQFDQEEETIFPDGCAALYRRQVLEEAGLFDSDFFAYGDDADLGLRARWLGWKCAYVPEAIVYHHHSSTSGSFSPQKVYWIERNRLWLSVKNFPWPLLLANPFLSLYRWGWNLWAALRGKGPAGMFRKQHSLWVMVRVLFRAYRDGLKVLGPLWVKRRRIRKSRRISDLQFYRLLWRFRVKARVLASQER